MLISDSDQFVKADFADEPEIEEVVQRFAEQLFGSNAIYLQKPVSARSVAGTPCRTA